MKRRLPSGSFSKSSPQRNDDEWKGKSSGDSSRRHYRRAHFVLASLVLLVLLFLFNFRSPWTQRSEILRPRLPSYFPVMNSTASWDWPLVHIVNTRFMQEQSRLPSLARARLALFRVFCLPTMTQQSSQKFLWIIKTDPDLDPFVLRALVEELRPYPNFFLVASNSNFLVNELFPGAWRGGAEARDLEQSRVYTGDRELLEAAMGRYATQDAIIETRLDADDGLHSKFLELVEALAIKTFLQRNETTTPTWRYWCSRRHIEWHFAEKKQGKEEIWDQITAFGGLVGIQHSNLCITPGFTVGFAPGTSEADVPLFPHDKVIKEIRKIRQEDACGLDNPADCIEFVENFVFEAIRSRTPTSAGMLRVEINSSEQTTDAWLYYAFLNMIHSKFGIPVENLVWINSYLSKHLLDIAHDNLLGQCTTGHSCKVRKFGVDIIFGLTSKDLGKGKKAPSGLN